MGNKVPRVTGEQAVAAFRKAGYEIDRTSGSHKILRHPTKVGLSVPVHKGCTIGVGLLARLIKDADMTIEEFRTLL